MKKEDFQFNLKDITFIGILCALAIVLDTFIKIPISLTGGSINIAMVPLILIALNKGWFKGLISGGIIFGLISCFIDGYGIATYFLDYFIGFGSVAVIGLFRKLIVTEKLSAGNYVFLAIAILCSMTIRFIGSTISGMVLYESPLGASAIYQLTYLGPSLAAILIIMVPSLKIFVSLFNRLS